MPLKQNLISKYLEYGFIHRPNEAIPEQHVPFTGIQYFQETGILVQEPHFELRPLVTPESYDRAFESPIRLEYWS